MPVLLKLLVASGLLLSSVLGLGFLVGGVLVVSRASHLHTGLGGLAMAGVGLWACAAIIDLRFRLAALRS